MRAVASCRMWKTGVWDGVSGETTSKHEIHTRYCSGLLSYAGMCVEG